MTQNFKTATDKKSFLLYKDLEPMLDKLTVIQAGHLFKAIYEYQNDGLKTPLDQVVDIAFSSILSHFKRDEKSYSKICNRNKTNGLKGGRPKNPDKPTGFSGNPKNPSKPDSDSDSDSDNGSDKEKHKNKRGRLAPPTLPLVVEYFISLESTKVEAETFFDHFTSNGWKVGGKAPMKSWQASARNWNRRSHKSNTKDLFRNQPINKDNL